MTAREVALQVVRDAFPAGGPTERGAQEALGYRSVKEKLDPRDRAFCTNLVFGAIKMRRALDWYLQPYVGQRGKPLPPAILEILRLAVYELQFSAAADHAVVSQWVNTAKKYGHRGTAGLVNAVLRSFLRDRPPPPVLADFEDEDEFFGTLYSYPTWIVRQWRAVFGSARVEALLKACNDPAQAAVTVNRTRRTREELQTWFAERGVSARLSDLAEDSLILDGAAVAAASESEAGGDWWLQSESSAMVVDVLNPQGDEIAVDACSGRGNKALQIAARLNGEAAIAIDRDRRKIETLERRAQSAGLKITAIAGDATAPILPQHADRVLIDAPCSGLGVLGRHPEARWRKRPDDGERLALTQRALLEALAPQLSQGGAIVYAVCSTDPRETTEVIEWCLRAHSVQRGIPDILVPPGLLGRDGFYVARLERR